MSSTLSASNNGQVTEGGFDYECTLRDDTRYLFIKEVNCAQAVPGQKPTNSEEKAPNEVMRIAATVTHTPLCRITEIAPPP